MKDPEIGLALIWRYFFEVFNFLKKRDFEKPDFPNFSEMICFWQKNRRNRTEENDYSENSENTELFESFLLR